MAILIGIYSDNDIIISMKMTKNGGYTQFSEFGRAETCDPNVKSPERFPRLILQYGGFLKLVEPLLSVVFLIFYCKPSSYWGTPILGNHMKF